MTNKSSSRVLGACRPNITLRGQRITSMNPLLNGLTSYFVGNLQTRATGTYFGNLGAFGRLHLPTRGFMGPSLKCRSASVGGGSVTPPSPWLSGLNLNDPTLVPAIIDLTSRLRNDATITGPTPVDFSFVISSAIGNSSVVQTAVSALISAAGINATTNLANYVPVSWWAPLAVPGGLFDRLVETGVIPRGTAQNADAVAPFIADLMVQSQGSTPFSQLSTKRQGVTESNLSAQERFTLPNGNVVTYDELVAAIYNSNLPGHWYGLYANGDLTVDNALLLPTPAVVAALLVDSVSDALNGAKTASNNNEPGVMLAKYCYLNIIQRFSAYLAPEDAVLLFSNTIENSRRIADIVCTEYSQSSPLGEFLRELLVFVKNQATLSQPADIGMSPIEARNATIGLRLVQLVNREASSFTTVEERRNRTGREILAIEAGFAIRRREIYAAYPLAQIVNFNIADVPPALFARLRRQIASDPAVAVRAKALAVRSYRVLEYLRYVSNPGAWRKLT